jgi:uncharacterized protein
VTVWAHTAILLGYLFVFASSLLAQTRSDSPVQKQLREAIKNLDANAVREAVRAGAELNFRVGGREFSVLGDADIVVLIGSDEPVTPEREERLIAIYDVLFELGARLQAGDADILQGPAIAGAPRVAKYLLERGANPNAADGDGNTPVILATEYGHPEVVTVLVAGGAKPLDSVTNAQIQMISAAGRGDLVALRRELTRGADVNRKSPTGETALVETVKRGELRGGNLLMVRELLKLGANPNVSGRYLGESSPLHAVVFNNERDFEGNNGPAIVDALLKAGANVSSTAAYKKQTPLHIAARMGNTKAAVLLLNASAKVMPRDEDGKTPLDLAESSAMIELLKAHGAKEQ